ncbi:MAG: peptide chain release factor N(5)-glutamine methyltransferase [Cyclobacteriaceae bacterium]|nr:peptide chain release factor N(5)-glutamine methyltransferase [Cyclobacteriaceae bacterium]
MESSRVLMQQVVEQITLPETDAEIRSMAFLVLENIFGLSREAIYAGRPVTITTQHEQQLNGVIARINQEEPVQYILEEAYFFGRKFQVNPAVLIPRPETEELVHCVLHATKAQHDHPVRIVDIGTGNGCIAITLALELKGAQVYATDISRPALALATENAKGLHAAVHFIEHTILQADIPVTNLDVVVSNPPYIAWKEKASMGKNVVKFEPHLALFVDDDDPLIFYKAIAKKSKGVLKKNGLLAFEINERLGKEVAALMDAIGYTGVAILNDMSGKARIVKGILS